MSVFVRLLSGSCGCRDLLACVYELNALETQSYFTLVQLPATRVEELAGSLQRDRSTVYRAVQKLVSLHLAERETVAMRGGGYYHVYRAVPADVVRSRIEQRMMLLQNVVTQSLAAFEEEVQRRVLETHARAQAHAQARAAAEAHARSQQ